MTNSMLAAAGVATTLLTLFAGSMAAAETASTGDGYQCVQARMPASHTRPLVTVCAGRAQNAQTQLRAADCDPRTKGEATMRAQCLAMMGDRQGDASKPAAAG
jgi:hypothetical protein